MVPCRTSLFIRTVLARTKCMKAVKLGVGQFKVISQVKDGLPKFADLKKPKS